MRVLFSAVVLVLFSFSHSISQDLNKILEKHYKAASQEKMEKVETMVVRGTNKLNMAGVESTYTAFQARPNLVRAEGEFQGSKVIQTYNGEQGWIYAPLMGIADPTEMKGEELKTLLNQAKFENDLWKYEAKGNQVEYESESEDGAAHVLKFTSNEGDVQFFYLDKKSSLISSVKSTQVMGGAETEVEILLSNYRDVKGIPVAHTISSKMNGQVVTTTLIDKVEFNRKLNRNLFDKPEVQ